MRSKEDGVKMAIIYQRNRSNNTTYVFESESFWDSEKKQSRSKRRCIGKLDEETGEIVPTGKRGREKKENPQLAEITGTAEEKIAHLSKIVDEQAGKLAQLESRISVLQEENKRLRNANDDAGRLDRKRKDQIARLVREVGSFAEKVRKMGEE